MPIDLKIEGTKELTNALVDMFSPVTNLLGTLGDRVRIYRELSLMRSLQRAKEIASEEGLVLSEPPLKFLVPFMEDCSLESPDEPELIEMWANLLASSGTDFKSEHNLFIRLLKEMTVSEARLLEYLVAQSSHDHSNEPWELEECASDWHDPFVYIKLRDCVDDLDRPLINESDFKQLERDFRAKAESPGAIIHFFDVCKGKKGEYPLDQVYTCPRQPIEEDFDRTSVAILISLGLVGEYVAPGFWFGELSIDLHAYYITELGAQFVDACTQLPTYGKPT